MGLIKENSSNPSQLLWSNRSDLPIWLNENFRIAHKVVFNSNDYRYRNDSNLKVLIMSILKWIDFRSQSNYLSFYLIGVVFGTLMSTISEIRTEVLLQVLPHLTPLILAAPNQLTSCFTRKDWAYGLLSITLETQHARWYQQHKLSSLNFGEIFLSCLNL